MIKSGFWAGSPVAEPAAEQNLARRMIIAFLIGSGGGGGDMIFGSGQREHGNAFLVRPDGVITRSCARA